MAEEQYAAYSYEFGYPPKQPSHLLAFAKKNGVKVTWGQAKALIKKAPDTSDYVPPPKKDSTGQIMNRPPAKRKNTEEKKSEKIEIAKRYSTHELVIDPQQLFSKRSSATKYQYLVSQLTAMGWDKDQSLAAIKASNGNLQLALESLMSGEINKPMITMNRTNKQQNQSPKKVKHNIQYNQQQTKSAAPKLKANKLQTFLNNIALGEYYHTFINYGFGDELSGLSDVDENMLKQMGISIMAHRKTILKQIHGADYFKQQKQQQQQQHQIANVDLDDAFEKLLGGHGSIKHRLRAMDEIYASLDFMNISTDNGKVLLSAYAEQILHEDYIYREYNVRIKGIQQISDVFIYCLSKLKGDQIELLIENSLPEILDNLFLLLDNNRAMKFHDMCRQCINKIIAAVINKNNKIITISLCGLLNEKVNIENVNQPHVRFYAAKLIFQHIVFNFDVALVNKMFNIDINKYDNKLVKYRNGINNLVIPANNCRQWFDLLIAKQWNDNDDETFKDIITDCLSILMLDPNCDICTVASNLVVYFNSFNDNFPNSLESEAKYRFNKYLLVTPDGNVMTHTPQPLKHVTQTPKQPVQTKNRYQHNGEVDYRIKQQTAVNVAPPTLPSI